MLRPKIDSSMAQNDQMLYLCSGRQVPSRNAVWPCKKARAANNKGIESRRFGGVAGYLETTAATASPGLSKAT